MPRLADLAISESTYRAAHLRVMRGEAMEMDASICEVYAAMDGPISVWDSGTQRWWRDAAGNRGIRGWVD